MEGLEQRRLFTATPIKVLSVVADDRGWVEIKLSKGIGAGVNIRKVFREFQAGPDGILNTLDDVQIAATVAYNTTTHTMTLKASTAAESSYRIKLYSSGLIDTDGLHLDGEFTGAFPSGNGVEGGDFQFRSKRDSSSLPTMRMTTSAGLVTVRLDKTNAPLTVANFVQYVDNGSLDGTAIHRNGRTEPNPINIIQGGGYTTANLPTGVHIATFAPVTLEAGIGNTRGTISMARLSDPNFDSATSEFFFNTQTNTFLNPTVPGQSGYAAFGTVISGMNVVDAIYAANTTSIGPFANVPLIGGNTVVLQHVAMQMKIATV